ncbi:MAG: winged helix-turn-helix transcriptional regulator [Promethearchaeota archaeon]
MGSDNKNREVSEKLLKWHCPHHDNAINCVEECCMGAILILLGKKHVLPIIRLLLLYGKLRFNEIEKKLGGSPKTITARLKELERFEIVKLEMFKEIPIRMEYSLTNHENELEDIFERISKWALKLKNL